MAVAAVTFGCHGGAQTKVVPGACTVPPPSLDPKPHQHPRRLPWSCFSSAWKILTFCGSRVCLEAVPPQNWEARLSSSQTPFPPSLEIGRGGGKAETLRIRSPGGAAPSLDAKQSTRTAPGWLIKYPFYSSFLKWLIIIKNPGVAVRGHGSYCRRERVR